MLTTSLPHVEVPSQGSIALKRALFCIECEVIFADLAHCPHCCSDVVWPLAGWLSAARPNESRTPALVAIAPVTTSVALDEGMRVAS